MTFLHLVWTSRFREQKTKNVALRVQMFRIIPTGCCFGRGWASGWWGGGGSFLVKSKCMARGSLQKKKKKNKRRNLCHTFAMAAHIPQSHGDENQSEKNKKKETNGRVTPFIAVSQRCSFSALRVFFFFFLRFTSEFYFENRKH